MTTLKTLLSDPRLHAPEFGARMYPESDRRLAAHTLNRKLKAAAELPEADAAAARREVQKLATDLAAGLRRPEGRPGAGADAGLFALAEDARLNQTALRKAIWGELASNSHREYWARARDGRRPLEPSEQRTLRVELQALVAACNAAINK